MTPAREREEVVLPKSGLALKRWSDDFFEDYEIREPLLVKVRRFTARIPIAWFNGARFEGTWEECIAWLDAHVLELAALLPKSAALVAVAEAAPLDPATEPKLREKTTSFGRAEIARLLALCTPEQQALFRKAFPYDAIPADRLETAHDLILRTLKKNALTSLAASEGKGTS